MSNKMKNKQYWVICQIQPERNYFNRLVATYTNFDKALANCKALNANYGKDIPDDFDCLDVSNVQELYKKYSLHCYVIFKTTGGISC